MRPTAGKESGGATFPRRWGRDDGRPAGLAPSKGCAVTAIDRFRKARSGCSPHPCGVRLFDAHVGDRHRANTSPVSRKVTLSPFATSATLRLWLLDRQPGAQAKHEGQQYSFFGAVMAQAAPPIQWPLVDFQR